MNPRSFPFYRLLEEFAPEGIVANYREIADRFSIEPSTARYWCLRLESAGFITITHKSGTHKKTFRAIERAG
jgi:hypothetical protein